MCGWNTQAVNHALVNHSWEELYSFDELQGTTLNGCVPESVELFQFDRLYILVGLKNGHQAQL